MRVYLDEQLGNFLGELRDQGHDVLYAGESGRSGRSDAWHFREAVEDDRAIITFNRRDFEYLHTLWTALRTMRVVESMHAGILTAGPTGEFKPVDWLPFVMAKLGETSPLNGRLFRYVASTNEWHEDAARPES